MATQIFASADRDAVHAEQARVIADGSYPNAECREPGIDGLHTLWDGADEQVIPAAPAAVPAVNLSTLDDATLARLAAMIAAQMKGG